MHHHPHSRPRRVLAYARVSTVAQGEHGTSLEAQQEAFARYCTEQNYPRPLVYVEVEGGGAEKVEKRVEQRRLMAEVREGDLVLCAKQDRWSRYTLHYLQSTEEIVRRGARFFSLAERFDPATPEGKFAAGQMALVAELEHSRIKDRTVGARRRLRARGFYVEGAPPFGYVADKPGRTIVIDERKAEVVRAMFDACIRGLSTRQIAALLRQRFPDVRGGLDHAAVARKLRDRQYLGEIRPSAKKGVRPKPGDLWIKGQHSAIIDEITFTRAQQALAARYIGRPPGAESATAHFLLRGLVTCGVCGGHMSAHPSRDKRHGGWYVCHRRIGGVKRCDGPMAPHLKLDELVEQDFLEKLDEWIRVLGKPLPKEAAAPAAPDFDRAKADLVRRRENLVERIADGTITADLARATLEKIAQRIAAVEADRAAHDAERRRETPKERRAALTELRQVARAWGLTTIAEKREIIRRRAAAITVDATGAPKWQREGRWEACVTWKKP